MRNIHICPKCDHREILRIAEVADAVGVGGEGLGTGAINYEQWSIAFRLARVERGHSATGMPLAGLVRAYVCRDCGYTEFYTDGVRDIPVDGKQVSLLRGPESEGPYR